MLRDHYVVCGLGHVGYRVASLLLDLGAPVSVVVFEGRADWIRDIRERGGLVIEGDARDEKLLALAEVGTAAALIACIDGDVVNLEIALTARRIHPPLYVVARIFDTNLKSRLHRSVGVDCALATTDFAAPAFATAALGDGVAATFRIGDTLWVVEQLAEALPEDVVAQVEQAGGLRLKLSEDAPEDYVVGLRPMLDRILRPQAPVRRAVQLRAAAASAIRKVFDPRTVVRFLGRIWRTTSVELRAVAGAITLLSIASVFVFHFAMGLTFIDALYFVITTVTTVGYGDISAKDATWPLKLYACVVMLLGSAAIATLYSILTDYLVTARLQQIVGRARARESGHVIVVGLGDVGFRVVEEVRRLGLPVVMIESDGGAENLERGRSHGMVVVGDARDPVTLVRAGAERAIAVVAATNDDATNLSIGLTTEAVNPHCRSVVRLFDPTFASNVQHVFQIDVAISASLIAAPGFVSAALYPHSLGAFIQGDQLFTVVAATDHLGPEAILMDVLPDGRISRADSEPTPGIQRVALVRRPLANRLR